GACAGAARRRALQDDAGQAASGDGGDGGDGAAGDPYRRALPRTRHHSPDTVSPCRPRWRATARRPAPPRRKAGLTAVYSSSSPQPQPVFVEPAAVRAAPFTGVEVTMVVKATSYAL